MEETVVRQAVPLQPMEVHSGADIHLQPVKEPTPEQVGALWIHKKRGAHTGADLLTALVTLWGTHTRAAYS